MVEKLPTNKTYQEIKGALTAPIPKEYISQKPAQGGTKINYVNVTDVKDLLDRRVGEENWDSVIMSHGTVGDQFVIVVRIRIHAFDGIFEQDGVGDEKLVVKGYGSTATNAYAQAFRRAAEGHGLARELWRGELSEEQINRPATPEQIRLLHSETARLKREEIKVANYYTNNRADLFADMTEAEARFAHDAMIKMPTPAKEGAKK